MPETESDLKGWHELHELVRKGEVHEGLVPYINRQLHEHGIITLETSDPGAHFVNPHIEQASHTVDEYVAKTKDTSIEGANSALVGVAEIAATTHSDSANDTLIDAIVIGAQEAPTPDNPIVQLERDGIIADDAMTESVRAIQQAGATDIAESAAILIDTAQGSLPPSWKERSISSEFTGASSIRLSRGGNIADTGWQPNLAIDTLPVSLPLNKNDTSKIEYKKIDTMSADELSLYSIGAETKGGKIDFSNLKPDAKQAFLTAHIIEIEAESQNTEARRIASLRNKERVESGVIVEAGDKIHGFESTHLRNVLNTGLVAGELIGQIGAHKPVQDTMPYNLDVHDAVAIEAIDEEGQLVWNKTNTHYGNITAVIDRKHSIVSSNYEMDHVQDEDHEIIFAGVPSTDIRSLHLHPRPSYAGTNPQDGALFDQQSREKEAQELAQVINDVVAEGVYIPVYDSSGTLTLSYDEYNARRKSKEYNLTGVEVPEADIIKLSGQYREKDTQKENASWEPNSHDGMIL